MLGRTWPQRQMFLRLRLTKSRRVLEASLDAVAPSNCLGIDQAWRDNAKTSRASVEYSCRDVLHTLGQSGRVVGVCWIVRALGGAPSREGCGRHSCIPLRICLRNVLIMGYWYCR